MSDQIWHDCPWSAGLPRVAEDVVRINVAWRCPICGAYWDLMLYRDGGMSGCRRGTGFNNRKLRRWQKNRLRELREADQ